MTRVRMAACLCLVLGLLSQPVRAEVNASIDRNSVSLSETFELRLRVAGAMNADEPELAPLQQDFEILSTSRNHRISLVQGQRESWTEWVVVLLAKRSGQLQIPPIAVGDESSTPIALEVSEGRSAGSTPAGDVSLELLPGTDEVHVQEQLLVTVRLLHAVNLASGASLDELEIPGAVVRKLDEGSHEQLIGGRRFGVFERLYAVFPQKSGEMQIPALRFRGSTGGDSWLDRFDTGSRQLRLQSDARTIRVLPPEQGASPWIPARNLSIVETWDSDPESLRAGESATRSLTITAEGLTGAQIPPIPEPDLPGVRFYADKAEVSDAAADAGLTGTRVQRVAVIPQRGGNLEFPELRVRWWNTVSNRFEEAVVPARILRVQGGTASTAPQGARAAAPVGANSKPEADIADTAAQATAPAPQPPLAWMLATAASLLLAGFFAVQWYRLRSAVPLPAAADDAAQYTEKQAFSRLEAACRAGDAGAASGALAEWARSAFPHSALRTPGALGALTGDAELRSAIDAMMASRYGSKTQAWDGSSLLAAASRHRPGRAARPEGLPPLYARG